MMTSFEGLKRWESDSLQRWENGCGRGDFFEGYGEFEGDYPHPDLFPEKDSLEEFDLQDGWEFCKRELSDFEVLLEKAQKEEEEAEEKLWGFQFDLEAGDLWTACSRNLDGFRTRELWRNYSWRGKNQWPKIDRGRIARARRKIDEKVDSEQRRIFDLGVLWEIEEEFDEPSYQECLDLHFRGFRYELF